MFSFSPFRGIFDTRRLVVILYYKKMLLHVVSGGRSKTARARQEGRHVKHHIDQNGSAEQEMLLRKATTHLEDSEGS